MNHSRVTTRFVTLVSFFLFIYSLGRKYVENKITYLFDRVSRVFFSIGGGTQYEGEVQRTRKYLVW